MLNKSLSTELFDKRNINVVILCRIQETLELNQRLRDKINMRWDFGKVDAYTSDRIVLSNGNKVFFAQPQRAQIDTRGISISLLLFSSSIEYNVRSEIIRDLRPQMIYGLGKIGALQI